MTQTRVSAIRRGWGPQMSKAASLCQNRAAMLSDTGVSCVHAVVRVRQRGPRGRGCGEGTHWNEGYSGQGSRDIHVAKNGVECSVTIMPCWQCQVSFRPVQSSSMGPSQVLSWEIRQKRMVLQSYFAIAPLSFLLLDVSTLFCVL